MSAKMIPWIEVQGIRKNAARKKIYPLAAPETRVAAGLAFYFQRIIF